ncbi:TauD/TfdA family dioxygenase [Streptomyces sp. NBC_01446]|uniref:TauD/TfdA dioxygenase family protein n=1 Tax=Streptomyces sp. NBC_01446 TaxID=2903870 RepID=UPI002B1CCBDE|nr:TauD/TfdA family dioxygenase [Streptomyces sp. NBC_01446]
MHPETRRQLLHVNRGFTSRIVGLSTQASRKLLDFLTRQADHPEYQVRLHWEPGTVAVWDNRATQHYAVSDYFPDHRVMERVTLVGDSPRLTIRDDAGTRVRVKHDVGRFPLSVDTLIIGS